LISGVEFTDYVETNILEPLGMNSSGFEQPISPIALSNAAQGYYVSDKDEFVPMNLNYLVPYPAGSFYTTGLDITKFMLTQLNGGNYNNHSLLNETTIQHMQERQFSHHPQLEGFCYGFYEYPDTDFRAIHHAGDLYGFASELMLFPEYKFGYFISQNSVGTGLRDVFNAVFTDAFLPDSYLPPQPTEDFESRKHLYNGLFWHTRYPHEFYEDYADSIPLSSINLSVNVESNLLITNITQFDQSFLLEWVEIEPFLFQINGTNVNLVLHLEEGRIKYIFFGLSSYERHEILAPSTTTTTEVNTSTTTDVTSTSETTTPTSSSSIEIGGLSLLIGIVTLYLKRKTEKNR
jgi:hypothetical protein